MTELEARISLNMLPEISSRCFKKILETFNSVNAALKASAKELEDVCALPKSLAQNFKSRIEAVDLGKELELVKKAGAEVILIESLKYPELLKEIYDPPPVLYVKGELPFKSLNIAVVGSRQASFYGLKIAEQFSYLLSSLGVTIVSGLARGIDTASHQGALKANAKTLAVLGSGLNCVYPPENKKLFERICEHGAIISEFSMETKPLARNFPRRNRIISGLSLAVLVVEAAKRSGALITASCALEQGREVFAVPGKADSPTSWGTNQLIKDGAKLVDNVEEIIQELNIGSNLILNQEPDKSKAGLNSLLCENERFALGSINDEPESFDEIAKKSNLSTSELLNCLTKLEIKGLIKQLPGKRFVLNSKIRKSERGSE